MKIRPKKHFHAMTKLTNMIDAMFLKNAVAGNAWFPKSILVYNMVRVP